MRISAKADYAVRAAMGLSLVDGPAKAEQIAQRHAIPLKFLEKILFDLRHAGLVATRRGPEGGYWLARDAAEITVAGLRIRLLKPTTYMNLSGQSVGAAVSYYKIPTERVLVA